MLIKLCTNIFYPGRDWRLSILGLTIFFYGNDVQCCELHSEYSVKITEIKNTTAGCISVFGLKEFHPPSHPGGIFYTILACIRACYYF